jgi:2-polyprenyl-6-methoxyphenol hydroxylase-like FAD-dependent oxidoreductase
MVDIQSDAGAEATGNKPDESVSVRPRFLDVDVVVVGGGLSGSLAAVVLGRAGHRVAVVDRHAEYPAEFRVEKIAGDQVELLGRLGLLDCVAAASTPFDRVVNVRRGRILDRTYGRHYGLLYEDIIRVVRAQLPRSVEFLVDRVVDVETSADLQQVRLAAGDVVNARLIVLATGMADVLRQKLGIVRRITFEKHSISFGFSIAPAPGHAFGFPSLTYYGEQMADRIDYLSLFPVGEAMRANLFTFRDHRDPWARDLRREPKQTLLRTLPGLAHFLGDFRVIDGVQNWIMDLCTVENYRRDGVVLIGDAFQTSCPAAGTGVSRLLTDVERLCTVHVPRWLASPGMGLEKIVQFYQDPAKREADRRALRLAHYRRSLTVDTGLRWAVHRRHVLLRRRVLGWVRDFRWARTSAATPVGPMLSASRRAVVRSKA